MDSLIIPKLQILIPQYKETEEVIKPLLDSIAIQQQVDLEHDISVIIVNDGSDVLLKPEWLETYPYTIRYFLNPHEGVSATRNRLLDHATADYVMWCDADDMFYISHALWLIIRDINQGEFDALNSVFLEEVYNKKGKFSELIRHEHDRCFVHGKVYRRQYLIDNNIRWNPKLSIHEDLYFNSLAIMSTKNIRYQETFFYVWRFRKDSLCRKDPQYALKTYINLLESNEALIDALLERENTVNAEFVMCFATFDFYYSLQLSPWHEEDAIEYRDKTEKRFSEMWKRKKDLFKNSSLDQIKKTSNIIRNKTVACGMGMEFISFRDWIAHIEEL